MSTTDIANDANDRISAMDAAATAAMTLLNNYMGDLLEIAGLLPSYNTVVDAIYAGTEHKFGEVHVPDFDQIGKSDDALTAAQQAADEMVDLNSGVATLLAEFKAALAAPQAKLEAIRGEVDAFSVPAFDFNEDNFIADIIEEVKEAIKDSLTQGPGESTQTEGGYYRNDATRRAASNQKELNDTMAEFSGRGWRLPSEILGDAAAMISAKQASDQRSADMEIVIQEEALSVENRQKAMEAGVRYDQILLSLHEHKMQRALLAAKTVFKLWQDLVALKFTVLDGLVESQRTGLAAVADGRRIVMADLQENMRKFGEKIDALISEAGGHFDSYHAEGQVFETASRAQGEVSAFGLSENELTLRTLLWNIHNGITTADENLSAFSKIAAIRLLAAQTGADMQTSLAKAVRRSITTVVQLLSGDVETASGTTV